MAVDAYALTSLATLKSYLGISSSTDDAILERSIDRASAAVERYCGRLFLTRDLVEWHDTFGHDRVVLKQRPVTEVKFVGIGYDAAIEIGSATASDVACSVTVTDTHVRLYRMSSAGTETETNLSFATYPTMALMSTAIAATSGFSSTLVSDAPSRRLRRIAGRDLINATVNLEAPDDTLADYQIDPEVGIVYGPTLRAYKACLVEYTGGYTTTPYDVEQAVLMMASRLYKGRTRDEGVQSESLGGYSYTLRSSGEIDAAAKEMLAGWRSLR